MLTLPNFGVDLRQYCFVLANVRTLAGTPTTPRDVLREVHKAIATVTSPDYPAKAPVHPRICKPLLRRKVPDEYGADGEVFSVSVCRECGQEYS